MSNENGQNTGSDSGKETQKGATGELKGAIAPALRHYPSPRSVRLNTLLAIRREMSAVYKDARCGRLPTAEATRLSYVLTQIAMLWEMTEFEPRLRALEQKAAADAQTPAAAVPR